VEPLSLRDEYQYQLVILEWDGGGTRVADVSQPAHDRSRRFVRSKKDTGCPNFLNQFGSDHVLGALPGRNAIGSGKLHARGVRVVSYSMAVEVGARMRTKVHQKVWPQVHGEIMRGLHREHAQEQSVDGTADQQSSSAIGPASREKKKGKTSHCNL